MAANKPDFSLGRVDLPDIGGGLLDFSATPSLTSKPEIDDKDIRTEIMDNL